MVLFFFRANLYAENEKIFFMFEKLKEPKCPRCWKLKPIAISGVCFRCDRMLNTL